MESVGRKSGRLERTSASKGHRGENVEKCRIPGASRSNERQDGDVMMKEDERREQKKKKKEE